MRNFSNKQVLNDTKKEQNQAAEYGFYSRLLKTDFDTVEALKEAEAAYLSEQEKKAAKVEERKSDADKVQVAFENLNIARKEYKYSMAELNKQYCDDLIELKERYEKGKAANQKMLERAETGYSEALKAFTDKYPEGYHLTLKDGDFETTIAGSSSNNNFIVSPTWPSDLLDLFFKF